MEFLRALPVLPVADLEAEVAFYETLTFHVQHRDGSFVALESGRVLFGLRHVPGSTPPPGFAWQLEVDDVPAVVALAPVPVQEEPRRQPSGAWTARLVTPAGYELVLEGGGTATGVDLRGLALNLPEVVELLEDGVVTYRRVGGGRLATHDGSQALIATDGGVTVPLDEVSSDHVEELLRAAWEENAPPPDDVGPLRTE